MTGKYKKEHGVSRVGAFLKGIGKSNLLGKIVGIGGKLLTGSPIAALSELLGKDKEITPEQKNHALEMFRLDLQDTQNARDNETARDTSENSPWLSKNIHEIIALFIIGAWVVSWYTLTKTDSAIIANAATLVLGYLFGRTQPQSK